MSPFFATRAPRNRSSWRLELREFYMPSLEIYSPHPQAFPDVFSRRASEMDWIMPLGSFEEFNKHFDDLKIRRSTGSSHTVRSSTYSGSCENEEVIQRLAVRINPHIIDRLNSLLKKRGISFPNSQSKQSPGTSLQGNDSPIKPENVEVKPASPVVDSRADFRYETIKTLGAGSEGTCTLVRPHGTQQLIVVKTVKHPRLSNGKPIEARILQDLFPRPHETLMRLHHYEYASEKSPARYYLEYCALGDLYGFVVQYATHGAFIPEAFIWKAFWQLASVLEFLHRGFVRDADPLHGPGIVHRDIKPENILLRSPKNGAAYPDLVLADFGAASFQYATYTPGGTEMWKPPEMPRSSPRGDVWSLGAVIHDLVYLSPPIADLPSGIEKTDENFDYWESKAEARQPKPKSKWPALYSEYLYETMILALEMEYGKRKNARQLLAAIEALADKSIWEENVNPLAHWAFKGMGVEEDEESAESRYEGRGWTRLSGKGDSPPPFLLPSAESVL